MNGRRVGVGDAGAARALLGDVRGRVHVAEEDGRVVAAAVWEQPDAGLCQLGACAVEGDSRVRLYALVRSVVQAATGAGNERGFFRLKDRALLGRLARDFRIEPVAAGWDPVSREAVEWTVEVDLADAREQLDSALARLGA